MRFTHAYAAAAVCSPTRAALMTGRAPARLGITDWIRPLAGQAWTEAEVRDAPAWTGGPKRRLLTPRNPRWMERDEITLAEILQARGNATGFVGKWHLGPAGWFPEDQGFDENAGGCDFGHPPHYFDPYPAEHQRATFPNLAPRRAGEYLTDREADEAVRFIRAHAGEPFFLCLWHYAVHAPIRAPEEVIERYRGKPAAEGDGQSFPAYAAMVERVDAALGGVLDTLAELDLDERTLIIFTSDNGGATHFRATDNRPLRSGKGRPYEGGLRVPFIVRWPGRIEAGRVSDVPISSIDVLPTVCAALGADAPDDRPIDGIDLMPLLEGRGEPAPRALFWHFPHYWWGGRQTPYSGVRDGDWKLIRWHETGDVELYDLARDPGEARDLAANEPERAPALAAKLDAWLEEVGAKRARPNPDFDAGP
jgi:arylsulfatase A-like enzyme